MARLIESLVGHHMQARKLIELLAQKRLPQSLVFAGPSGVGKKFVALSLAQALVCEKNNEACGECGPCLRMAKQQSESLYILQPEGETGKKALIKVEAVREMLDRLSLTAISKARIVIIDEAHLMNDQAANAFLKNLEEPSPDVYFILITPEVQLLLPTIQSRVQVIRFGGLSVEQLKAIRPQQADWSYLSARGQLDRLAQLNSKQGLEERAEALELLENFCFNEDFLVVDDWRKPLRDDRNWALYALKCWLQLVRDAVVYKTGKVDSVLNVDQKNLLEQLSANSFEKLVWFAAALTRAQKDIQGYQDASLVVDSLRVQYARMD